MNTTLNMFKRFYIHVAHNERSTILDYKKNTI